MIGKRLRQLRNEKKISQEELSRLINISRPTYAQYEIDRRVPEYNTLERLADYFNVSLDYLVGRSEYRSLMKDNHWIFSEIDLSNEEMLDKVPMVYEGIELTIEEKKEFMAIYRGISSARKGLK
jgi:transcriptional regulator with XRE-family HTH domain